MKGKVYLVGAGPGDPGLLTLKGKDVLERADVVIYDALVSPCLLNHARSGSELVYVGKRGGGDSTSQDDIQALLILKAQEGKVVVRLKGGDPFIFGRGAEEALALARHQIPWEVVPGVTSAIAAPSYAGIPLTQRDLTSSVTFMTGHEDPLKENSAIDWSKISYHSTLVFLMGFSRLDLIIQQLLRHGFSQDKLCALIMWGTLSTQKTVSGSLVNIQDRAKQLGFSSPAVFVVGDVVKLREELNWFETGPLFGKKIVVTRSREQASDLVRALKSLGADTLEFPVIKIEPPLDWASVDHEIENINRYDWLVLTSVNGVNIFLERLKLVGKDIRDLKGLKIAAIGLATKEALEKFLIRVDISPEDFISEGLVEEFRKIDSIRGKKALLPRADLARDALSAGLRGLGMEVKEVVLYRTIPDEDSQKHSGSIVQGNFDWVTFTSSSTVKNFISIFGDQLKNMQGRFKVASIGPITSRTARDLGLRVDIEAKIHSIPGLIEEIVKYHAS